MSRLIDADALVWVLKHSKTYYKVIALDVVLDAVRCSPTIDAVEVVRCKECMWWINNLTEYSADEDYLKCRWNEEESPNADDFCSYGERKDERADDE